MTWACTIRAVPPMVNADSDRIRGEAVYVGWFSSGSSSRQRSQPPRFRARMEAWWVSGTCRITSPGLFIPPVSSESTSQRPNRSRSRPPRSPAASRGIDATPDTRQSIRITTAQDGTGFDNPTSSASPRTGEAEKQRKPSGPARSESCSPAPPRRRASRRRGRTSTARCPGRAMVENTTGSATSVRARGHLGLRPDHHRLRLRRRQPERHLAAGRGRRPELHPDQLEELDVVQVRHPVQPVDQLIDHLRERLDQGDPGIGDVVVGPGRATLLDQPLGVVDQVLEMPVVEIRGGQHDQKPPVGPVAGMVGVGGVETPGRAARSVWSARRRGRADRRAGWARSRPESRRTGRRGSVGRSARGSRSRCRRTAPRR